MTRFSFFAMLIVACTACRLHHHEQMTPHFTSSPDQQADCFHSSGRIVIAGKYHSENMYVQNPIVYCDDSTQRYCAYQVVLNDSIFLQGDSLAQSIFMIRLTNRGFQQGDSTRVVINHYNGGMPVVLNPEVR